MTSVVIWSAQNGYRSSLLPLCLCDFLLELRGCQQTAEPAKRLIAQPAGRRLTRNQQRNAVRAYVEDVLAAVDATKFAYNEVTERLRRYSHRTCERAARDHQ